MEYSSVCNGILREATAYCISCYSIELDRHKSCEWKKLVSRFEMQRQRLFSATLVAVVVLSLLADSAHNEQPVNPGDTGLSSATAVEGMIGIHLNSSKLNYI